MTAKAEHEKYMKLCLKLAKKGAGFVSPNPMVGAILVKNGKIVGTGYHKKFGDAHAEVNAINSAGENAAGATLYINLEPCSFYGKTLPCTDLIIKNEIKKVIVGMRDPNPVVNGKGIEILRKAGIEVIENVLLDEAKQLNESFEKFIIKKLPFVTLKIAQTIDGKIADYKGNSKWISNLESRKLVHRLRSEYDAVLIGANTVEKDNPELTVRLVKGRNPIRLILDGNFSLSNNLKIFNTNTSKTYLFVSEASLNKKENIAKKFRDKGIEIVSIKSIANKLPLDKVLMKIGQLNIASVLVEGGASIFSQFIESRLADKVICFISPKILGSGKDAIKREENILLSNSLDLKYVSYKFLNGDLLIEGYLN